MRRGIGLALLALFAVVLLTARTANAAGAACHTDPASGPPGTRFDITCTGFSANTHVNAYVVEPDGRAIAAAQMTGFLSNENSGSILTDQNGNASFSWQTESGRVELDGGGAFAHQFGEWTWVVHELGLARAVLAQGEVHVTVEATNWEQVGATLAATGTDAANWTVTGTGFWRDEYVNIWVSLPPNCSGRANVEPASAEDPFFMGAYDGFTGPSTVKADKIGAISFPLVFSAQACRGIYYVTAYAPGSGYGAITQLTVLGDSVTLTAGQAISVVPTSLDALQPLLTILGSGWSPGEEVSCWSTRPDGRGFDLGQTRADAAGNFALDVSVSGDDSYSPYASEEPGIWSLTCRASPSGHTAVTSVTVHALTSDP